MPSSSSYIHSSPTGIGGFAAWQAWRQDETYLFLGLQALSVMFALAISYRDRRERERAKSREEMGGRVGVKAE
jgi:uncharacterized membrane protein